MGEARQDGDFDSGWIINADTRQKIWALTWTRVHAGGWRREEPRRPAHEDAAGRTLRGVLRHRRLARSLRMERPAAPRSRRLGPARPRHRRVGASSRENLPVRTRPAASTFVALTGLGDSADAARGFTIARPMDVRIYALGEGRDGRMFDYGWIVGPSHRRVWEMRYEDTEPAGGDPRTGWSIASCISNRRLHRLLRDRRQSHSAKKWKRPRRQTAGDGGSRCSPPTASSGPSAVTTHAEVADPSIIAQLVRVRDRRAAEDHVHDGAGRATCASTRSGEADGDEMADYGWIEDAKGGRKVWEMKYRAHRAGRRRDEEPPVRRHDHAPGRRLRAPLRDRRIACVRRLEREPAGRPDRVGHHDLPQQSLIGQTNGLDTPSQYKQT